MTLLELFLIPLAISASLAFLLRGLWKPQIKAQPACSGKCSCKSTFRK
jgi:hypothetical protein